jgi:DNA-binding CsgD family transcriptional regulator
MAVGTPRNPLRHPSPNPGSFNLFVKDLTFRNIMSRTPLEQSHPELCSQIINLRYAGNTYKQIAEILNTCPVKACRVWKTYQQLPCYLGAFDWRVGKPGAVSVKRRDPERWARLVAERTNGRTLASIAAELNVSIQTVSKTMRDVQVSEGKLQIKLPKPPEPDLVDAVWDRLSSGQSVVSIAQSLGVSPYTVRRAIYHLERQGKYPTQAIFRESARLEACNPDKVEQIRVLHEQGFSARSIIRQLKTSHEAVIRVLEEAKIAEEDEGDACPPGLDPIDDGVVVRRVNGKLVVTGM